MRLFEVDAWLFLLDLRVKTVKSEVFSRIGHGSALAPSSCVTPDELKARTKLFAVETIKFTRTLATDPVTAHITKQLVKSGTSVGANYRSSCRAKSKADFVSKMATVEEEADEVGYWLELLVEIDAASQKAISKLLDEAEQIVRITVASIKTARGRSH